MQRPSKKLQAKYIGPYTIEKIISPVAYKLQLPDTLHIHPVFHISQLKKYKENPEEFSERKKIPPTSIWIEDKEEFEVEQILDKRIKRKGRGQWIEYLVKWKGYEDYDNSWEPIDNLKH